LQEHRAFCREYDKIAHAVDRALVGSAPSKATFYRWLSGGNSGLPYPAHCRILETMFRGWTVADLFGPWDGRTVPGASPGTTAEHETATDLAGLAAVYISRSEFAHELPPHALLDDATTVHAVGLSLNVLCQQYPGSKLKSLFGRADVRVLFLDPAGEAIKVRNSEEGHEDGQLSTITTANINVLKRVCSELDKTASPRVELRKYDETVRFNIMLVNDRTCVMQPYLPENRGLDSPTFVMERKSDDSLYDVFSQVFFSLWERSKPL
jgi:hypothetical protein